MAISGALDAITIDALHIIKRYKEKYSDQDIEAMMALGAKNERTLSQADRAKLREFSDDFAVYMQAVKSMKLPQPAEKVDNRSIEERFPEFAAALTYRAPQYGQADDSSEDDEKTADVNKLRIRNAPK
jgi:formiminotetrahydrofolate cyclodeaminase